MWYFIQWAHYSDVIRSGDSVERLKKTSSTSYRVHLTGVTYTEYRDELDYFINSTEMWNMSVSSFLFLSVGSVSLHTGERVSVQLLWATDWGTSAGWCGSSDLRVWCSHPTEKLTSPPESDSYCRTVTGACTDTYNILMIINSKLPSAHLHMINIWHYSDLHNKRHKSFSTLLDIINYTSEIIRPTPRVSHTNSLQQTFCTTLALVVGTRVRNWYLHRSQYNLMFLQFHKYHIYWNFFCIIWFSAQQIKLN